MTDIKGREIELPDRRSVFVGTQDGNQSVFIQFVNGGAIQRFRLSREAADALVSILLDNTDDGRPASYPRPTGEPTWRWHVVKDIDA